MKSISREFVKYTSANVMGMIGLSCYILADTFFVAQGLGANGLTALNLALPVYSLIFGVGLMIGVGGATRFTLRKKETAFSESLFFGVLFAAFFLLMIPAAPTIGRFLGAEDRVLSDTVTYLRVILCFSPAFLLNEIVLCFVRNDSAPRLSMVSMISGSFFNVVMDYVLIFPCRLGMLGAAVATGVSPVVGLFILSRHFTKKNHTFRAMRPILSVRVFGETLSLGAAALINELSSGLSMMVYNYLFLYESGNLGVAAYSIVANIALVVISIMTGVAQGSQPLVSRAFGEGKEREGKTVLWLGLSAAILLSGIIYAVSFPWAEPIAEVFNKAHDPSLTALAAQGIRLYFVGFLFAGMNVVSAAYFAAKGSGAASFWISVARGFIVIVPAALILSRLGGVLGTWLSMPLTEGLVFFMSVVILLRENRLMGAKKGGFYGKN